jgi:hypothetical protein
MAYMSYAQLKPAAMLIAFAMVVATAAGARAATATWDPNTEPNVAGYRLSYGTQSGVYTVVIDVGKVTTYQFFPPPGQRYYVVVQAYNTAGELSPMSSEVVIDIPGSGGGSASGPPLGGSQPPPAGNQPIAGAPALPPPTLPNATNPVSLVRPVNQTSVVNRYTALGLTFGNLYGNPLSFSASGLPPGLSIGATGAITGVPTTIGVYQVGVTVSDGSSSAHANFSWAIVAALPAGPATVNHAPAIDQIENQKSPIDLPVSFQLRAADPEGAPLTFSAIGLPPGLSIGPSSGTISGAGSELGSYQVSVTVSDGEMTTVRHFTWSVVKVNSGTSEAASADGRSSATSADDYVDVTGDFDGDGRADLATYRRSSSEWRIWTSGSKFSTPVVMVWGEFGDRPVAADYNGDRITDFGVYRPSTGTWHLSLSGSQTPLAIQWGGPDDLPVPLDHDGDGKADLALIRHGGYDILLSSANYLKSVQVR